MALQEWQDGQAGGTPITAEALNELSGEVARRITDDRIGALNGVAPLDGTGTVPLAYLPPLAESPYEGAFQKLRALLGTRESRTVNLVFAGSSTVGGANATTRDADFPHRVTLAFRQAFPMAFGVSQPPFALNIDDQPWTLNRGIRGVNVGFGGSTSTDYLPAATVTKIGALKAALVLHSIGSNDYAAQMPIATYKANVLGRAAALRAAGHDGLQLFVHSFARRDVTNPAITWDEYGNALAEIAQTSPDYVFLDASTPFTLLGLPATDAYGMLSADNIHTKDGGHGILAEEVTRFFGIAPATDSGWRPIVFGTGNGYTNRAGFPCEYRVVGREVKFRGGVVRSDAAAIPSSQLGVANIPAEFAPTSQWTGTGQTNVQNNTAMVYVTPTGTVFIWPGTSPTYVMLNSVSYFLD